MHIKQTIRNSCFSFFIVILFDFIYCILGLLVTENINIRSFQVVIVITLFCVLLFVGYMIGQRFFSEAKVKIVSIVIIPIIMLFLLFGFGMLGFSLICLIMQYPVLILIESVSADIQISNNTSLFYGMVILYHLMCCSSLLVGSYHKTHTQ